MAQRLNPDLIICDIMMPLMDGVELTRRLKQSPRTNFIPIIVHSIKEERQSIREAMKAGAQAYIIKPFEPENLIFCINNLLSSRDHYARKLKVEQITEPSDIEVSSSGQLLLHKISTIVEKNMNNPLFDIELLASELGMSRMQLYRQMKRMPGGKTISEIIRDMRIKRAAQLLSTGEFRVTEVMYKVGFNNHYQFIKYFRESYGMVPRDYIRANSETNMLIHT